MSWLDRINAAVQRKARGYSGFMKDDELAASLWKSCAVNEAIQAYPVGTIVVRPVDETLAELGGRFTQAVKADLPWSALDLYVRIRQRVAKLKRLGRN